MRPGAEQELLSSPGLWGHRPCPQTTKVDKRISHEDVVPGADVVHGDIDVTVLTFDINRPPVWSIVGMGEVVAQIGSDVLEQIPPVHQGQTTIRFWRERVSEVDGPQQVGSDPGPQGLLEPLAVDGIASQEDDVRHLPTQGERAAGVINPALVEVRRCRHWKGAAQVRWPRGREQVLRRAEIGLTQRADLTVGVG